MEKILSFPAIPHGPLTYDIGSDGVVVVSDAKNNPVALMSQDAFARIRENFSPPASSKKEA